MIRISLSDTRPIKTPEMLANSASGNLATESYLVVAKTVVVLRRRISLILRIESLSLAIESLLLGSKYPTRDILSIRFLAR